jgi:hypothetical protein
VAEFSDAVSYFFVAYVKNGFYAEGCAKFHAMLQI